jgi:hypothetical protein
MLALTSPTSSLRSVGIVRLRTKATEFSFLVLFSLLMTEIESIFRDVGVFVNMGNGTSQNSSFTQRVTPSAIYFTFKIVMVDPKQSM